MNHSNSQKRIEQQKFNQIRSAANASTFYELLSSTELTGIIEGELQQIDYRSRHFPPLTTLSLFVEQLLNSDHSCQEVINAMNIDRIANDLPELSSSTGAYCQARQRLPLSLISNTTRALGRLMQENVSGSLLVEERQIKLIDGTTILMPDTEDLQDTYPQHGQQQEGAGFPIMRLVAAISLNTGAVLDMAYGPYKGKSTGEYSLFRELDDVFNAGDIMLADRYYCSYFLISSMINKGVDVLFEQHGARHTDFRFGKKLGVRDHLIELKKPAKPSWMSKEMYQAAPKSIQVRETRINGKVLVTTLVNHKDYPRKKLDAMYRKRWHVELDLRNIKATLGMSMLRCKSVQMCHKELWTTMMAYNLIRVLMLQAAEVSGVNPRQISFKHTVQIWTNWRQTGCSTTDSHKLNRLWQLIASKKVGLRPGRVEPRVVKQRPKPYPRLKTKRQVERDRIKQYGHAKKLAA